MRLSCMVFVGCITPQCFLRPTEICIHVDVYIDRDICIYSLGSSSKGYVLFICKLLFTNVYSLGSCGEGYFNLLCCMFMYLHVFSKSMSGSILCGTLFKYM